jgi:predicted RNA-binding Zn-ribbon protein involved in translation (DUF1610 family)
MSDETIANGEPVFDAQGTELGVVTGATTDGFTVSISEAVEYVEPASSGGGPEAAVESTTDSDRHDIEPQEHDPGPEFGEGFIMWRCANCGEMGELADGFPSTCPNCGDAAVAKWTED